MDPFQCPHVVDESSSRTFGGSTRGLSERSDVAKGFDRSSRGVASSSVARASFSVNLSLVDMTYVQASADPSVCQHSSHDKRGLPFRAKFEGQTAGHGFVETRQCQCATLALWGATMSSKASKQ